VRSSTSSARMSRLAFAAPGSVRSQPASPLTAVGTTWRPLAAAPGPVNVRQCRRVQTFFTFSRLRPLLLRPRELACGAVGAPTSVRRLAPLPGGDQWRRAKALHMEDLQIARGHPRVRLPTDRAREASGVSQPTRKPPFWTDCCEQCHRPHVAALTRSSGAAARHIRRSADSGALPTVMKGATRLISSLSTRMSTFTTCEEGTSSLVDSVRRRRAGRDPHRRIHRPYSGLNDAGFGTATIASEDCSGLRSGLTSLHARFSLGFDPRTDSCHYSHKGARWPN
jgi:hypothetical protein